MQKSPVGKFKLWAPSDNIPKFHKPALEALGDLKGSKTPILKVRQLQLSKLLQPSIAARKANNPQNEV